MRHYNLPALKRVEIQSTLMPSCTHSCWLIKWIITNTYKYLGTQPDNKRERTRSLHTPH